MIALRKPALVVALLLPGIAVAGDCAPEKLARIVFRNATTGVDVKSSDAKPRTLYRLGAKYLRMEEELDAENGIHGLIISAEPDSWMINLAAKSGQHAVDRHEPFVTRAPVFGSPDEPDLFKGFEFGCELAYMKSRNVRPETTIVGRFTLDRYHVTETAPDGTRTILLDIIQGTERPLYASLYRNDKAELLFQYVQYDLNLKPDMRLFVPPKGITITQAEAPEERAPAAPQGAGKEKPR